MPNPHNIFDQTARYAAKHLDAPDYLTWLLPHVFAVRLFSAWLDTRTIPFPGEADRTCDTVARCDHKYGTEPPAAMVIEYEARLPPRALQKLATYALRVHDEIRVELTWLSEGLNCGDAEPEELVPIAGRVPEAVRRTAAPADEVPAAAAEHPGRGL